MALIADSPPPVLRCRWENPVWCSCWAARWTPCPVVRCVVTNPPPASVPTQTERVTCTGRPRVSAATAEQSQLTMNARGFCTRWDEKDIIRCSQLGFHLLSWSWREPGTRLKKDGVYYCAASPPLLTTVKATAERQLLATGLGEECCPIQDSSILTVQGPHLENCV